MTEVVSLCGWLERRATYSLFPSVSATLGAPSHWFGHIYTLLLNLNMSFSSKVGHYYMPTH